MMPDIITAEERALIDAHIAAHGVTVCVPGRLSDWKVGNWKDSRRKAAQMKRLHRARRFRALAEREGKDLPRARPVWSDQV